MLMSDIQGYVRGSSFKKSFYRQFFFGEIAAHIEFVSIKPFVCFFV